MKKQAPEDIVNSMFAEPDPKIFSDEHVSRAMRLHGVPKSAEHQRKLSEASLGRVTFIPDEAAKKRKSEQFKKLGIKPSELCKQRHAEAMKTRVVSEITKKKLSDAGKGRKMTPEQRQRFIENQTGRVLSEATKQKIRESLLGRRLTEEQKAANALIRQAKREVNGKRFVSEETRAKMSLASRARKVSPETREKLRQANLGKQHTPEQRARQSQRMKGRKHSPETIEKMRATQQRLAAEKLLSKQGK